MHDISAVTVNDSAVTAQLAKSLEAGPVKLGELLIELGIANAEDINTAISISQQTGLPLGRTMVLCDVLGDQSLNQILCCQSAINHGAVKLEDAKRALVHALHNKGSFENSLVALGLVADLKKDVHLLGKLLVEAGFVSEADLMKAVHKGKVMGLPFGRLLVLNGVVSESSLTSVLNALVFVRDGKIDKEQAILALREVRLRHVSVEAHLQEKGFYSFPKRNCPKLGELLLLCGIISQTDLIGCLELSLIKHIPVGQVMIDCKFVSASDVEVALKVQNMIAADRLRVSEARNVLLAVKEGMSLGEALAEFCSAPQGRSAGSIVPSLYEFLNRLGILTEDQVIDAFKQVLHNSELLSQVLLLSGVMSSDTLDRAASCRGFIQERKMTPEHCNIAFDYSERLNIPLIQALKDLQWYHHDDAESPAPTNFSCVALKKDALPEQSGALAKWQEIQRRLSYLSAVGSTNQCIELHLELLELARNHFPERIIDCLDAVASQACLQGKLDLAEDYYRQALVLREACDDPTGRALAAGYSNLGKISYFKKDYDLAELFTEKYVQITSAALGAEHPDVACGWQNLGNVFYAQRKFQKAASCYKTGLQICNKTLGECHPATIKLSKSLEVVQEYLSKYARPQSSEAKAAKTAITMTADVESGFITGSWRTVNAQPDELLHEKS